MFIVERLSAAAAIRDQAEINGVIDSLTSRGYRPVLRSMVKSACEVLTLGSNAMGVESLVNRDIRFRVGMPRPDTPIGDLLMSAESKIAERCYFVQPVNDQLFAFELRHHCVSSGISAFCKQVEEVVHLRLDGRRVRGMKFDWRPIKDPPARRFAGSSRQPEPDLKVKKADYTPDQLAASQLLIRPEVRNLLLQLAQIGKVRAADAKVPTALIEELLAADLISKEFLILCKKDSRTLCQVVNFEDFNAVSGGKMTCATCGRKFSDELVHEIFAGTDVGKRLITGSYWMMIWLTELLIQSGLNKDAIVWSATSGDDEIDIMTDELGLRMMFELKDREFGLGDAYPFAYRLERYGGNLGVVVSTERVADEATKFFQELRSRSSVSIEALVGSNIATGIRDQIDAYSRTGVLRTMSNIAGSLGINLSPFLQGWMEMFASEVRGNRYRLASPPAVTTPSVQP